jgi:acyl transferase domain-containing protein
VLSARSEAALRAQAARLADFVRARGDVTGVARALATSRGALEQRGVVVASGREELLGGLESLATGDADGGVASGAVGPDQRPVLVFPGQGSQWTGMGLELADAFPAFAEALDECAAALRSWAGWDLRTELSGELSRVDVVQPASWAVMVALARLWQSFGVTPAAVVGHSQGEIAAAVIAGGLSLDDGAQVVARRSQIIGERLAGHGAMLTIALPADAVAKRLEDLGAGDGRLSVAAVNGPEATVVAGDPPAIEKWAAALRDEGVWVRRIAVDYASHSQQVEVVRDELLAALSGITPRGGDIPLYSTVTGELIDTRELDAHYWVRNLRQTVRFEEAVRGLARAGHGIFVEASAHPVLTVGVTETLRAADSAAAVVGSLRRDEGGARRFVRSLAQAWVSGAPVDWRRLTPAAPPSSLPELPTYPFQRKRYWLTDTAPQGAPPTAAADEHERRFWEAVESADLPSLSTLLDVSGDEPLRAALPALSDWRRRSREQSLTRSWMYEESWEPLAGASAAAGRAAGTWLAVVPPEAGSSSGNATASAVVDLLTHSGADVRRLTVDAADAAAHDRAGIAALLERAFAETPHIGGVLSLLALDERPHPEHTGLAAGVAGTLLLTQAMADLGDRAAGARLWCATQSAVAGPDGAAENPGQAQIWGLGRVAALEHPRLWGGLVDLPGLVDATADDPRNRWLAPALAGALVNEAGEDQLALRRGRAHVRRMARVKPAAPDAAAEWRPRGTVLITGGSGPMERHVARWLAAHGAEHLVLTDPAAPEGAEDRLGAELAPHGVRVTVAACDPADRTQLAALAKRLAGDGDTVRAVMHTAAAAELKALTETGLPGLARAVSAKAVTAQHLADVLDQDALDAVVYFSSVTGFWGSGQHTAHATATAHLDALAQQRRARGQAATSVAWALWEAPGDGGDDGESGEEQARALRNARGSGLPPLRPERALSALHQAVAGGHPCVAVADIAWDRFVPTFTLARPSRLIEGVPDARAVLAAAESAGGEQPDDGQASGELRNRLAGLPEEEQHHELIRLVCTHVGSVLGHGRGEALEPQRTFRHLGIESITAIELRNALNAATGLRLPATLVFEYPTPAALAGHLRTAIVRDGPRTVDGLHAELDRMDADLSRISASEAERVQITRRLEKILATWNGAGDSNPEAAEAVADKLESASDDEMFEFLHKELGKPI